MNVDKLQKINALANEFKKHNFAQSNEDAYKQAEAVYGPKTAPTKDPDITPIAQDAIAEKKFELILQMNNRKLEQELTMIKSAIKQLSEELNALKQIRTEPPKKPVQQELKTETKEMHPKQGRYTSSDVDIQKMFYFGTKR